MKYVSALVLALVGTVLAACSTSPAEDDSGDETLNPGAVAESYAEVNGQHVFITIPTGRVDFVVSPPTQDVPATDVTQSTAAEGGSVVGVSWSVDWQSRFAAMSDDAAQAVDPHVALVADGREYSLDDAMLVSRNPDGDGRGHGLELFGSVWLGVHSQPQDLAIMVEFDGLKQVAEVDTFGDRARGRAAALYDSPDDLAENISPCPRAQIGARLAPEPYVCLITSAQVPYQSSVGWVPSPRSTWQVVSISVDPDGLDTRAAACGEPKLGEITYRLNGREPREVTRSRAVFALRGLTHGPKNLVIRAPLTFPSPEAGAGSCAPQTVTWRTSVY